MNKKSIFKLFALPMLVAGAMATVSCTDYQTDLDQLGAREDTSEDRLDNLEATADTAAVDFRLVQESVNGPEVGEAATDVVLKYEVSMPEYAEVIAANWSNILKIDVQKKALRNEAVANGDATLTITNVTAAGGVLTITATQAGFEGGKYYAFRLVQSVLQIDAFKDGKQSKNKYIQGKSEYNDVFVVTYPTALTITGLQDGAIIDADKDYVLSGVLTPSYTTEDEVVWTVTDADGNACPDVATIDQNGTLHALGNGVIKITATTKDKDDNPISQTITVEIKGGNVPVNTTGVNQDQAQ